MQLLLRASMADLHKWSEKKEMEFEEIHTACSHRMRKHNIRHISDVAEVVDSNIVVADDVEALIDHRSTTA